MLQLRSTAPRTSAASFEGIRVIIPFFAKDPNQLLLTDSLNRLVRKLYAIIDYQIEVEDTHATQS
jgi:hypothetical protein